EDHRAGLRRGELPPIGGVREKADGVGTGAGQRADAAHDALRIADELAAEARCELAQRRRHRYPRRGIRAPAERSATAGALRATLGAATLGAPALAAQHLQHLRRHVDRVAVVERVRDDQVVVLFARILLHVLQQRALQLVDLLVATDVRVLEKLVLRPLQVALAVADLPLEAQTLRLAHHGRIASEGLGLLLELALARLQLPLTRRELVLQRG